MKLKRGDKVKVNFLKSDGSTFYRQGKFQEKMDKTYGVVVLSQGASVTAPLSTIERILK